MKKGSTSAAQQSRKISRQKLTIGLDLGDRTSWYCVLVQQSLESAPTPLRKNPTNRPGRLGQQSPTILRRDTVGDRVIVVARVISHTDPTAA
jgi:hypothetical protein